MKVKLKHLLDLIDYNRESPNERIQVVKPNSDWDEIDEVGTASALLLPLYEAEIKCIEAVEKDIIRVDIDWDKLNLYGWDDSEKKGEEQ